MEDFFASIEKFFKSIVDLVMGILERAGVIKPEDAPEAPEADAVK